MATLQPQLVPHRSIVSRSCCLSPRLLHLLLTHLAGKGVPPSLEVEDPDRAVGWPAPRSKLVPSRAG